MCHADAVTYTTTILGILRAGHVAFPISPRNSAAAVANLLSKTKCNQIFVSQDPHMSSLVDQAIAGLDHVTQHAMPLFEDLFLPRETEDHSRVHSAPEMPQYDLEGPALILHSSGMQLTLAMH